LTMTTTFKHCSTLPFEFTVKKKNFCCMKSSLTWIHSSQDVKDHHSGYIQITHTHTHTEKKISTSSSSQYETSSACNEKRNCLSDIHQYPPYMCALGQTTLQGRDHQSTLYSEAETNAAIFADRAGATKSFTLGYRGYVSSTRVGSVALLGNQEGVEYYRNDSPVKRVSNKES
jgi:hypothetical protein